MSIKNINANVTNTQRYAIDNEYNKYNCSVKVFNTNFTVPSLGASFASFNISDSNLTSPAKAIPSDNNRRAFGTIPNIMLDWDTGNPPGVTTDKWQTLVYGVLFGFDGVSNPDITFKLVYKGSAILSCEGDTTNYDNFGNDDLTSVLIDDWLYTGSEEIKIKIATYSPTASSNGGLSFRLRFWNSSSNPHLVCFIKRGGIDNEFRLLSASCVSNSDENIIAGSDIATTYETINKVTNYTISRDHDQIPAATVILRIDDDLDTNSFNSEAEKFGGISKGNLIAIYGGYNGDLIKRFVGNITSSIEVSRDEKGTLLKLGCEGILAKAIDTLNFNYPMQSSYSYAGYFSDNYLYAEPDGVKRVHAFDKWDINKIAEVMLLHSDIDPKYFYAYKKYYQSTGAIYTSDLRHMFDLGLSLSGYPKIINSLNNVNYDNNQYIWEYDFGQDTAYDIIKDILNKYGYFISEIASGQYCGYFSLISSNVPIETKLSASEYDSSNYTESVKARDAEGFLVTRMGEGESSLQFDWTGKGIDLCFGRGSGFANNVSVYYKNKKEDTDWSSVYGYINDGTFTYNNIIHPVHLSDITTYYYSGINLSTGHNPTVYRLFFGYDSNGIVDTDLNFGVHSIKIDKTSGESIVDFNCSFIYDFGEAPYKEYSTNKHINNGLSLEHDIKDIRNEITVLGASTAGFSYTPDSSNLEEIKNKYVTSRAIDVRSIYDSSYKYYVGSRKHFIIQDPTIITQDRADWLALYTLERTRKTGFIASFSIPCDLGLDLYQGIRVHDTKTESVDRSLKFYIYGLSETFSNSEFSLAISADSRDIPPSFRKRRYPTPAELATVFNNCPVAFEEMKIPYRAGEVAYNPMDSDQGKYIEFSWVLLVPGIQALEIFDTHTTQTSLNSNRVPVYGTETLAYNDELVSVPYVGKTEDRAGLYFAKWDGVHQAYDLNTVFNDTPYSIVYKLPRGHGFFARGQNTKPEDEVDPIASYENIDRSYKKLYFPLYPVLKFEPTVPGYEDVTTVYQFGTQNGTSIVNGIHNTLNDNTAFDITHFWLDERVPLVWDFAEEYMPLPSDEYTAKIDYTDPYRDTLTPLRNSSLYSADAYANGDRTHSVMEYDPRPPRGWDGSHSAGSGIKTYALPVIDTTVGVRLYEDTTTVSKNRYFIDKFYFHIAAITTTQENSFYQVNSGVHTSGDVWDTDYTVGSGNHEDVPWISSTYYNLVYSKVFDPVNATDLVIAEQKVKIGEWTYIPAVSDRTTESSIVFRSNFSNNPHITALAGISERYLNKASSIPGIGVGKVFAASPDNLPILNKNGSINFENLKNAYGVIVPYYETTPKVYDTDIPRFNYLYYPNGYADADTKGVIRNATYTHGITNFSFGANHYWSSYDGTTRHSRIIYNSLVLGLELRIRDRAGRLYFSAAKEDTGGILIGKHNEIEIHNPYSKFLLKYVNRYNPFLPLACYSERNPANISMENFGGSALINYDTTISINTTVDVVGDYLHESVALNGKLYPEVSATPTWSNSSSFLEDRDYVDLFVNYDRYGFSALIWGNGLEKQNSNGYAYWETMNTGVRDSTLSESVTCYGLPLWFLGADKAGFTETPMAGSNLYDLHRDVLLYDEGSMPTSVRAGGTTYLNRTPVFVRCGHCEKAKYTKF